MSETGTRDRARRVAIVTCLVKPEPDPDEEPLLEALTKRGLVAEPVAWDDPSASWGSFDLCVLRSTWNYIHHYPDFLTWLDRVEAASRVENPPARVRWNLDKRYLRELAARGVPIPATVWVERGEAVDLAELALGRGWSDVVVKPVVGAASFGTRRFGATELAEGAQFLAKHARERAMMVQPYLKSVEDYGERSVVWLDGELTHAVRKNPRFGGGDERVSAACAIADDEARVARAILAPTADDLLYARIDLARDASGNVVLMELELAEPSLYLIQSPPALARFADALARRARRRGEDDG